MDLELFPTFGLQPVVARPLVLAADDNEDNLLLLLHALELFGFSHVSTLKGKAVPRMARTYQPDLILLDIVLSDISGVEVIQTLKADPETCQIPIIAVTALAKCSERDQILALGCRDYLNKPYNLDELEAMVHRNLSLLPSAS